MAGRSQTAPYVNIPSHIYFSVYQNDSDECNPDMLESIGSLPLMPMKCVIHLITDNLFLDIDVNYTNVPLPSVKVQQQLFHSNC